MTLEKAINPDGELPKEVTQMSTNPDHLPEHDQQITDHLGNEVPPLNVQSPSPDFGDDEQGARIRRANAEASEAKSNKYFSREHLKKTGIRIGVALGGVAVVGAGAAAWVSHAVSSAENGTESQNNPGVSAPQNPGEVQNNTSETAPSYDSYTLPYFYEEGDKEYETVQQAATETRLSVSDAEAFNSGDPSVVNDIVSDNLAQKIQVALSLIKQAEISGQEANIDFLTNGDQEVYDNLKSSLDYFGDDPDLGTADYVPVYNICRTTTDYTDDQDSCIEGAATTDYTNQTGAIFTIQRITADDMTGFNSENAERWNSNFNPVLIDGTRLVLQSSAQ